ncbi:hypothetical protein QLQ12_21165 [Actinoplanes sp. NEAU-A12]|uniref:Uncharacterized protein n=1 Tax=Actinoplanes sandaracinus TaxID=3045177 RepID=A0ABT6WN27_9ACTN|nr:hypothetical protein [Actinoplanes sandaracinus]MDI6101128.1 hypothetical protein [Actinoplanes sandaracinus]
MGSIRLRAAGALATGTAMVATLAGATPAGAAPAPKPATNMEFSASPNETTPGSPVVLSGWAGFIGRDTGNAGKVEFWFRKGEKDPKVYLGSTNASSSGKFRFPVRATATGQYVAHYQHQKQDVGADGTDHLDVYNNRAVDRMLYSWTATALSCLPSCKTTGPEQFISAGPVKVKLSRECLQPKSGGRIGFTDDPKNAFKAGEPGWREFPEGEGPVEFELKPKVTRGHFYLEWTSAPAPAGGLTSCNLSFTASQTDIHKDYF